MTEGLPSSVVRREIERRSILLVLIEELTLKLNAYINSIGQKTTAD
jgi:hypothetical protein